MSRARRPRIHESVVPTNSLIFRAESSSAPLRCRPNEFNRRADALLPVGTTLVLYIHLRLPPPPPPPSSTLPLLFLLLFPSSSSFLRRRVALRRLARTVRILKFIIRRVIKSAVPLLSSRWYSHLNHQRKRRWLLKLR